MTTPERSVEEIREFVREQIRLINYKGGGVPGGDWAADEITEYITQTIQAERQKRDEMVEESRVSLLFLAEKVLKEINDTYAIDIKHANKKQWLEPAEFERIFLHRFNEAGLQALTQPNNP